MGPTEAALDEKSEILAEWFVDPKIEAQSDLTTAHQLATSKCSRGRTGYRSRQPGRVDTHY